MHYYGFLHFAPLFALLGILTKELVYGLRDVAVNVPHAVRRGERALLRCSYDIEDDSLYSVKWYKGRREFYRYTPKENPAMKLFPFPSVKVDRYSSNESQIILESVTMNTAGKYSCEVSADAPSFHTLIAAAELDVIEPPHNSPIISGIRPRYRVGDILRGNCTSRHSRPAANLTWTVNGDEVNPSNVRHHKILRDVRNDMETSIIGIHFVITPQHFVHGKLRLRCTAHIHDVYWKTTERSIEDDHHHKHTKHQTTNSVNMVPSEPYDQYALQDSDLLRKKDTYLTQIQDFLFHFVPSGEDASSLNAGGSAGHSMHGTKTHAPLALAALLLGWAIKELLLVLLVQPAGVASTSASSFALTNNNLNVVSRQRSTTSCHNAWKASLGTSGHSTNTDRLRRRLRLQGAQQKQPSGQLHLQT